MTSKPSTSASYVPKQTQRVRAICLLLISKLGALSDDFVVVGGLVPSLLISQEERDRHVGTMDLDMGLALGIFSEDKYEDIEQRLLAAGFAPDEKENGNRTRHRWKEKVTGATIDFLIPQTSETAEQGRIQGFTDKLGAVVTPGLELAFEKRRQVSLVDQVPSGANATRKIWVCEAGPYVVLKSLAFHKRGENKDAYDLYYLLRNYEGGIGAIARQMRELSVTPQREEAIAYLRDNFLDHNGLGPRAVAEFIYDGPHDDVQADTVGYVSVLLRQL